MFEEEASRSPVSGAGGPVLDADSIAGWVRDLGRVGEDMGDAERVDLIRGLEELKAAARATTVAGPTAASPRP